MSMHIGRAEKFLQWENVKTRFGGKSREKLLTEFFDQKKNFARLQNKYKNTVG
jgi:hypothetical protein